MKATAEMLKVGWGEYKPGYWVGVAGSGPLTQASYLTFDPPTILYHFLAIRARLEEEDDYEIIEMLGSPLGWLTNDPDCAVGRLSWYLDRPFVVFRLNDPEADALGKKAAKYASKFGRVHYDYSLFFKLPWACLKCWFWQLIREHRLHRIDPTELDIPWDAVFVCTELAKAIWLEVEKNIIALLDTGVPSAFVKSYLNGRSSIAGWNLPAGSEPERMIPGWKPVKIK